MSNLTPVQLTFNFSDPKAAAEMLARLGDLNAAGACKAQASTPTEVSETKKVKKTEAKAAPAAAIEEDITFGDDAPAATTDAAEAAPETEAAREVTYEMLIDSFKAYATKHTRDKAGELLKKLNVKSVKDLKKDQYDAVFLMLQK